MVTDDKELSSTRIGHYDIILDTEAGDIKYRLFVDGGISLYDFLMKAHKTECSEIKWLKKISDGFHYDYMADFFESYVSKAFFYDLSKDITPYVYYTGISSKQEIKEAKEVHKKISEILKDEEDVSKSITFDTGTKIMDLLYSLNSGVLNAYWGKIRDLNEALFNFKVFNRSYSKEMQLSEGRRHYLSSKYYKMHSSDKGCNIFFDDGTYYYKLSNKELKKVYMSMLLDGNKTFDAKIGKVITLKPSYKTTVIILYSLDIEELSEIITKLEEIKYY